MANDSEALHAILRSDFHPFAKKVFETTQGGESLVDNWHIQSLAWHLQQCAEGKIKRLIINIAPRHLKSLLASVALPLWLLGRDPTVPIICVSYGEELAFKFSRERRQCMGEPWYRKAFPNTKPSKKKDSERESVTTKGGSCYATSVGGALTGRGARFIIIDDPLKTGDFASEAERKRVNEWYSDTLYSRLNNKNDDVIIIVMQRLHVDDLVGHVLERDDWTVLNLASIAPEDQKIKVGENQYYHRAKGELLHEEREDQEALDKIKANLGSLKFEAQYQQNPLPHEGNMVKRGWFKRYSKRPAIVTFERILQSWDTAVECTPDASYSVCITAGWKDQQLYILDVLRERLEFHELEEAAIRLASKWQATHILIEKASSGIALLQNLRRHTRLPTIAVPVRGDKITRLAQVSGLIEAGRLVLPQDAIWLAVFERELLAFPGDKYDDQVDALTHLLRWADAPSIPQLEGRFLALGGGSSVKDSYFNRTGVPTFNF